MINGGNMKKILILLLVFVLSISTACSGNTNKEKNTSTKKVDLESGEVASVNGQPILEDDFNKHYALIKFQYEKIYGKDYFSNQDIVDKLKKDLLDEMVHTELIKQYAKKNNIKVNEKTIKQSVSNAKKTIENNEELKKMVKQNGIDDEFIKQSVYAEELTNLIIKDISEKIKNDEGKLHELTENYIIKVKASHILIKDEKEANKIYNLLKEDSSQFEKIAKEKSIDKASAQNGGDLGFFYRGRMIPEFEEAAFNGEVGQVQKPVKTDYGYHIIKTTDKATISSVKTDNNAQEIKEITKQVIMNESRIEFNKTMEEFKKQSKIIKGKHK